MKIRIRRKNEMTKEHREAFQEVPDATAFRMPDFNKPILNMHLMSDCNEMATIQLRKGMTAEQLMDDYIKAFPKECKKFLEYVRMRNKGLLHESGMSKHGTIMVLGSIPETIKIGMAYLFGEHYWSKKSNLYGFFRKFPRMMIGSHSRKTTRGVIVK